MITAEQILAEFPEARESESDGHIEYYVHCRRSHRKGGIYKMSINGDTGLYYCHDCGASGSVLNDYLDIANQFLPSSIEREAVVQKKKKKEYIEWKDGIPSPGDMMEMSSLDDDHPAIVYVKKRGMTVDIISRYGITYCRKGQYKFSNGGGTTSGRIVFPVYMLGKLVGWQARIIDTFTPRGRRAVWQGEDIGWIYPIKQEDGTWSDFIVPKYFTCPGMKRGASIFGFDLALAQGKDLVVITEGPVDCLKVGQKSISTFGSKLTNQQIRIIKSNWDSIIWLLDKDIDTESTWFHRVLSDLSTGSSVNWLKLSSCLDPGESNQQEIWKEIHQHIIKT